MVGVSKILPNNNKTLLKDIYLSFFYGAKIGIIGLNGAGKSTLMKIIAGIDKPTRGEVVFAPGYSVGYLEQDPQMSPDKTVLEVVEEGVQDVMRLLSRYNEVCRHLGDIIDDTVMYALFEEQAELTEKIEAVNVGSQERVNSTTFSVSNCDQDSLKGTQATMHGWLRSWAMISPHSL